MTKDELKAYLNKHIPDAYQCDVVPSLAYPGTFDAVITKYKDGVLQTQIFQAGWERRTDAFTYSIGMLRNLCVPQGALTEPTEG
jgi:hypothetical protein